MFDMSLCSPVLHGQLLLGRVVRDIRDETMAAMTTVSSSKVKGRRRWVLPHDSTSRSTLILVSPEPHVRRYSRHFYKGSESILAPCHGFASSEPVTVYGVRCGRILRSGSPVRGVSKCYTE